MMYQILSWNLDLVAFVLFSTISMLTGHMVLRRRAGRGYPVICWLAVMGLILAGGLFAVKSGQNEQAKLRRMVDGIAPTYAAEMHQEGLETITPSTSKDDPTYLKLIETQKRWLAANSAVTDIYTFGKRDATHYCILVDSETDFNHNGQIDSKREQRTRIGELYTQDTDGIKAGFIGKTTFSTDPITDRWGSWISSTVPVRNNKGEIYAVLGVDYNASEWIESILFTRVVVLTMTGTVVGVIVGAIGLTVFSRCEILKRRETEIALRQSEQELRAIFNNEPECVMILDKQSRIVDINPSGLRILGADRDDMIGHSVLPLLAREYQATFKEHHQLAVNGQADIKEFEFIGRSGGELRVWLEVHSVPLPHENKSKEQVLCVARDITSRKMAEKEREQLHRQFLDASRQAGMAEVATGVLHNVGNVLNSVNVSTSVVTEKIKLSKVNQLSNATALLLQNEKHLTEYLSEDEKGRQLPRYLVKLSQHLIDEQKSILEELLHMAQGVEHIKEVVRLQQTFARSSTVYIDLDPATLFEDALRVNLISAEHGYIRVVRDFEPGPSLMLDKHKILQILVNLIGNASKAMDGCDTRQRVLTVRIKRFTESKTIDFIVTDSGVGIAPENLSRIFQHGFTTRSDGHGFGLHSAANYVNEMGGKISVNSEGLSKGATFVVTLPALLKGDTCHV